VQSVFTHIYDIFLLCLDVFLFSVFTTFILSVILPYACPVFMYDSNIRDCLYVFFISSMKCSARLSHVFQWAIHTFHLVYATFLVLIYLRVGFIAFLLRDATFICAWIKSFVIFFVYFPLYLKITNFVFWCCRRVFLLCLCCFECLMPKFLFIVM
jgi:hypothetical protein